MEKKPKSAETPTSDPSPWFSEQPADGSRVDAYDKPIPTAAQIAAAAKDIIVKQRVVATAAAFVGAAFTQWEKSCGISKKRLRETIARINEDLSVAEALADHAENTRYLMAVGVLPVADDAWTEAVRQADLGLEAVAAGGEIGEELRLERAKIRGHKAGLKGRPVISNPWASRPGSPEFVGWLDGHGEGLALRKELNPDKASTVHADDSRERVEPDPDSIGATAGSA